MQPCTKQALHKTGVARGPHVAVPRACCMRQLAFYFRSVCQHLQRIATMCSDFLPLNRRPMQGPCYPRQNLWPWSGGGGEGCEENIFCTALQNILMYICISGILYIYTEKNTRIWSHSFYRKFTQKFKKVRCRLDFVLSCLNICLMFTLRYWKFMRKKII